MAGRRCPGPRCPRILTNGERYCDVHAREYEVRRGSPTQRGYDAAHVQLRASWQSRIDSGERVTCATCPTVLTGRGWHLGHTDDRTAYLGPQCVSCNDGEAGRRGAQARR